MYPRGKRTPGEQAVYPRGKASPGGTRKVPMGEKVPMWEQARCTRAVSSPLGEQARCTRAEKVPLGKKVSHGGISKVYPCGKASLGGTKKVPMGEKFPWGKSSHGGTSKVYPCGNFFPGEIRKALPWGNKESSHGGTRCTHAESAPLGEQEKFPLGNKPGLPVRKGSPWGNKPRCTVRVCDRVGISPYHLRYELATTSTTTGIQRFRIVLYLMVCWQKRPSFKAFGPINRASAPFFGSFLSPIFRTFQFARRSVLVCTSTGTLKTANFGLAGCSPTRETT